MMNRQPLFSVLDDGRRVAYAEYGDPAGFPCVVLHGSPGSRLFASLLDGPARSAGLRLIAPDRPGFGQSDPLESYTILGVAGDTLALARNIGLDDRFAVVGVSGGAPYVYAMATLAPDRLAVAGIVSGLAPVEDDELVGRNGRLVAAIHSSSRVVQFRLSMSMRLLGRAVRLGRRLPGPLRRVGASMFTRSLPPRDRAAMMRLADDGIADMAEAMRQGGRFAKQEMSAFFGTPWGFRLEDVRTRVLLWHGTDDQNVPCSAARRVATLLPSCEPRFFDGEAHLMFVDHVDEILRSVVDATGRRL